MNKKKPKLEPELDIKVGPEEGNIKHLEAIARQIEKSTMVNREILKSTRFIKTYYLWKSTYNIIKVVILVAIVVLGLISWRSIVDGFLSTYG